MLCSNGATAWHVCETKPCSLDIQSFCFTQFPRSGTNFNITIMKVAKKCFHSTTRLCCRVVEWKYDTLLLVYVTPYSRQCRESPAERKHGTLRSDLRYLLHGQCRVFWDQVLVKYSDAAARKYSWIAHDKSVAYIAMLPAGLCV